MKNIKLNCDILDKLDKTFYSKLNITPLHNPKIVSINRPLANQLGFTSENLNSENFLKFLNGEYLAKGSTTYSKAYSGHQFGYFVPNLGDGRAINLGKLNNYHLQLKGAGLTPYSRNGDGRAVLRSTIREYLLSEAMYALKISTTRAIAMITSDSKVLREYESEQGAIVLRASTSWIRFGSFEYAYMGKNKEQNLKQLADFVIEESYPEFQNVSNKYEELYFAVVDKTIEMIALWQSIGFMHGVMNTDNMSIEGLTIDYGPYAMMEEFDKGFICNLSDHEGRYSFENQPFIAQWNLSVLAKVLSPIADHKLLESYNDTFIGKFKKRYFAIMKEKLGLYNTDIDDTSLILRLFSALHSESIDYNSFFWNISNGDFSSIDTHQMKAWLELYEKRLEKEKVSKESRLVKMKKINPKYILRNYMLQDAIDVAQKGDFSLVNSLLTIAQNPYDEHEEFHHYTQLSKNFKTLKCSCSS
ncbi:MAG: YdiU family protein [Arcobacteraceae bacterium]|nr:YdiU family protein [Arcobacteraceae bacterium]